MKALVGSLELIARAALFMTVITLSLKHMLRERKQAKAEPDRRELR